MRPIKYVAGREAWNNTIMRDKITALKIPVHLLIKCFPLPLSIVTWLHPKSNSNYKCEYQQTRVRFVKTIQFLDFFEIYERCDCKCHNTSQYYFGEVVKHPTRMLITKLQKKSTTYSVRKRRVHTTTTTDTMLTTCVCPPIY